MRAAVQTLRSIGAFAHCCPPLLCASLTSAHKIDSNRFSLALYRRPEFEFEFAPDLQTLLNSFLPLASY